MHYLLTVNISHVKNCNIIRANDRRQKFVDCGMSRIWHSCHTHHNLHCPTCNAPPVMPHLYCPTTRTSTCIALLPATLPLITPLQHILQTSLQNASLVWKNANSINTHALTHCLIDSKLWITYDVLGQEVITIGLDIHMLRKYFNCIYSKAVLLVSIGKHLLVHFVIHKYESRYNWWSECKT